MVKAILPLVIVLLLAVLGGGMEAIAWLTLGFIAGIAYGLSIADNWMKEQEKN
jgi:hypothetical protein